MKVAAFRTICCGYKVVKKQKTASLFLPFEYFIAPSISPSGSNEPELSMREIRKQNSVGYICYKSRFFYFKIKSGKLQSRDLSLEEVLNSVEDG